jgi:hypothetical protein
MFPNGISKEGNRLRLKERCPLKAAKKIAAQYPNGCPCSHPKFNGYGCTANRALSSLLINSLSEFMSKITSNKIPSLYPF